MCRPTSESRLAPTSCIAEKGRPSQTLKRRRRVSIQQEQQVVRVECFAFLQEHQRDTIWYRESEIQDFRESARNTCRKLKERLGALSYGESARGLEFRTDRQRQERKHYTVKCVVKAQKKYPDPLHLARLYRKCNLWTTASALAVAQKDFISAYDLALPTSDIPSITDFPMPFRSTATAKRAAVDTATTNVMDNSRNVRPRVQTVI